jgi:hypothetical protein
MTAAAGTTDFLTDLDNIDGVDNVLGDAGGVDFEPEVVEEPASDEGGIVLGSGILSLSLLGLWTFPSLAYSQGKLRRIRRLQEGVRRCTGK